MGKQNHFKELLIMEYISKTPKDIKSELIFKKIDKTNVKDFADQNFVDIKKEININEYLGVYINEQPVAFGCVVFKGKGDYFDVVECDGYIQELFVFPDYRGKGIMGELLKYLTQKNGVYRLCVRSNNISGIKCYEKFGFYKIKKRYVFRLYKKISFPRYKI